MICCVIANYHPMIGCDFHDGFPAFIPLPKVPLAPHVVFALVRFGPWWMAGSQENTDIQTPPGDVMAKIFDIGMFIPHITLPALDHWGWMIIYTLLSSSQGHFGVASVQTPKGPIAVALMLFANPQLDCEVPIPPLPTGMVLAPNTVVAGLTLGDLIAGLLSMVLMSAATWLIGKAIGFGLGKLGSGLLRVLSPRITLPATLLIAVLEQRFPVTTQIATQLFHIVLGWTVGSPMGYSFPWSPLGGLTTPIQSVSEWVGQKVDSVANPAGLNDYFNHTALLPPFPLGPAPVPIPVPVP